MPKIRVPAFDDDAIDAFLRSVIYSVAGQGKTPLITTFPDCMYPVVYLAADPTSPFLDSIEYEDRKRMIVLEPDGWPDRYAGKERWYDELAQIMMADWVNWGAGCEALLGKARHTMAMREWPEGPKTFVWDTASMSAEHMLLQNAREKNIQGDQEGGGHAALGAVNEEHESGALTESVQPGRPDYLMVQNAMHQLLTWLYKHRMHVIVGSQEGESKKQIDSAGCNIGPITAGSGSIRQFAQRFTTNFHLYRELDTLNVWMAPHDGYTATFKTPSTRKVPERIQLPNSAQARRDFWQYVLDIKFGDPEAEQSPTPSEDSDG